MKLRVTFPRQQLLSALGCLWMLSCAAIAQQAPPAGQATFKVRGSTVGSQQGTVIGASPAGVKVRIGAQEITLPPAMFESFQMAPPPEYAQGYQAFAARDYPAALRLIKSVTDKYRGLPTDWAQYACGILGDIYVGMNDFPNAEAAYNDYKRTYQAGGSSSPTSEVGLARIALAKKDFAGAKARLDPITSEALKQKNPAQQQALAYSQAFFVSGQAKEAEGNLPGALEDYLRTVTIFYHDPAAVSAAQERADSLRAGKTPPVTVP